MADTVRTLAALQTLLADNTTGDISAQDVRDMLVSLFTPQFVGCQLTKSGTQVLGNGTVDVVTFDGTNYDTDSFADLDNDRITVPTDFGGYYVATGAYITTGGAISNAIEIHLNGNVVASQENTDGSLSPAGQVSTEPILLVAGDDIDLRAYNATGRTISATTNSNGTTWLAMYRVGQVPG